MNEIGIHPLMSELRNCAVSTQGDKTPPQGEEDPVVCNNLTRQDTALRGISKYRKSNSSRPHLHNALKNLE